MYITQTSQIHYVQIKTLLLPLTPRSASPYRLLLLVDYKVILSQKHENHASPTFSQPLTKSLVLTNTGLHPLLPLLSLRPSPCPLPVSSPLSPISSEMSWDNLLLCESHFTIAISRPCLYTRSFPDGSVGKNLPAMPEALD